MGLMRVNSGSGKGPKFTPSPVATQKSYAANNMQAKGSTPGGREAAKQHPHSNVKANRGG